jgi:hypothetical protein
LFVKDQDLEITYLKTLPNLPDDEALTECNVDDDSEGDGDENDDNSPSVNAIKKR